MIEDRMILSERSHKIVDSFCPGGYARPGMYATRLRSNLEASRLPLLSLSRGELVIVVLFG